MTVSSSTFFAISYFFSYVNLTLSLSLLSCGLSAIFFAREIKWRIQEQKCVQLFWGFETLMHSLFLKKLLISFEVESSGIKNAFSLLLNGKFCCHLTFKLSKTFWPLNMQAVIDRCMHSTLIKVKYVFCWTVEDQRLYAKLITEIVLQNSILILQDWV